jgi:LPPG:FO 2-phospho-L-lactate transferase
MTVRVAALCGGVGGAKLALGLAGRLGPDLAVVVNTGDDFEHLGLHVSPDIDTVVYTLAGLADPEQGWGRRDETWTFMAVLDSLGGETWFRLGDGDLAMHVERTRRLRAGERLTEVTRGLARRLGIEAVVLPMSDEPVRTLVDTDAGTLTFQHYFVRERCAPVVRGLRFDGAERATMTAEVRAVLSSPTLEAILLCPSNPYLSVDPLLAVPGFRDALVHAEAPRIAVSPIVGGRAIKGPAAKIMHELGLEVAARTVASHYEGLIDGFVLDEADAAEADPTGVPTLVTATVMRTLEDREHLADACLDFARGLGRRS